MYEILAFGTLWFWVLLTISVCVITYYVNVGNGFGSTIMFIATVLAFAFLGNSKFFIIILNYVKDNPGTIIGFFVGYLFIGAIWSIIKWYYFLVDNKEEQKEKAKKYKDPKSYKYNIPAASDYKGDIILWMSYWPLSSLWTLVDNPFKKIFYKMFNSLESLYEKMSKRVFADVNNNLAE